MKKDTVSEYYYKILKDLELDDLEIEDYDIFDFTEIITKIEKVFDINLGNELYDLFKEGHEAVIEYIRKLID